jgi:sarcosine oxidase subunit beta
MTSPIDSEIVVIGGGIAGASTAYHLAAHGRQVTLLERGEIASEASGVNMGGIDSYGFGEAPDLQAWLTAGSVEIFKDLQIEHGENIELRGSGGVQAIHTPEQWEYERERVALYQKKGQVAELLSIRDARGLEPELSPKLLGALYAPLRWNADPRKATVAFARVAARRGARVLTNRAVTTITPKGSGYTIGTAAGDVVAGSIVIAAGAWCAPIGRMLGLEIPIVPIRGQMWRTAATTPSVFHTISAAESPLAWSKDRGGQPPDLTHRDGTRVTRHLYGRQRRNGEIIFGGDREMLGETKTPNPVGVDTNRGHAIEVLPFLANLPIAETWAGLMPFPLDGKPICGRIEERDNLWIVTGLASSGFGRGPMLGKFLADHLHTGKPAPVLADADPAGRVVRRPEG